ncbi:MAG: hypothetical protein ABFD92_07835 [Planctomycetaceae bacterium]|nr:hypothetical protein [Planctomycetaceae bacterium]
MSARKTDLYKLLARPPKNVQAELQAAWDALVAAFGALPKAKRKKVQQEMDDDLIASLPPPWRVRIAAALTAKREKEYA